MAFIPITKDLIENVTLALHPQRNFISSSLGVTGSIPLVVRPSSFIKKINPTTSVFAEGTLNSIDGYLKDASKKVNAGILDVSGDLNSYLGFVNQQTQTQINTISFSPVRYSQPVNFSNDNGSPFLLKKEIKDNLMPYYRHGFSKCDFSCGNYHTLNFFSSSDIPNDVALIYPNSTTASGRQYTPDGAFSIDFFLNPRYLAKSGSDFDAGTIMHLSSTFAVSLVTGSSKDQNQNTDKFRILLQLSHSADIPPSQISIPAVESGASNPLDLAFISEDNSLTHNTWHRVTIRWGGASRSYGTGSIIIDTSETKFCVPSSSIASYNKSEALVIGNYFQGPDFNGKFFNSQVAYDEGITSFPAYTEDPIGFQFSNPLQAEIHDLKIYRRFLSDLDLVNTSTASSVSDPDLALYVPPVFSMESPVRETLVTPFQSRRSTTTSPFNVDMSYGVNGFYINLENFTKDYASDQYPRLFNLTGSIYTGYVLNETANDILYTDYKVVKRNLTILPNDNGLIKPDFSVISNQSGSYFVDDLSCIDHSIISMREVATDKYFKGLPGDLASIGGASPTDLTKAIGPGLTLAQRFKDPSSNQVVIFDISNLGYGNRILPGTFKITDNNITGSDGNVSLTIVDDGQGSLYRADSLTRPAKWSSVGNVFYNEGVAILSSPSLAFFAKDQMTLSFKGEQTTPVMVVNIPCPAGLINSSSNPTYEAFPASELVSEREDRFVYITGINLHDENLNVIMRANLAQPVVKRDSDEFMFRIKFDF